MDLMLLIKLPVFSDICGQRASAMCELLFVSSHYLGRLQFQTNIGLVAEWSSQNSYHCSLHYLTTILKVQPYAM